MYVLPAITFSVLPTVAKNFFLETGIDIGLAITFSRQ